jgi:DNA-binding transcriptional MerR regulator
MRTYTIGEVEEITGIKAHILRYWEEVIPSFAPQKDTGNRRVYTPRDLQTVRRLRYLITEKRFTIEGARSQLILEAGLVHADTDATQALLRDLSEAKNSLTDIYFKVRHGRTLD